MDWGERMRALLLIVKLMLGQVDSGKIDWIPQGRCLTQESRNREEDRKDSGVNAAIQLLQQQVRVTRFSASTKSGIVWVMCA